MKLVKTTFAAALLVAALTTASCAPTPEVPTGMEQCQPEAEPVVQTDGSGTLADPWAPGHSLVVDADSPGGFRYTATVKLIDDDAEREVLAASQFNEPAPEGQRYVVIEATITNQHAEPAAPLSPNQATFYWNLSNEYGAIYRQTFSDPPGENIHRAPDLYLGQSVTGQLVYLVPADIERLLLTVYGEYVAL